MTLPPKGEESAKLEESTDFQKEVTGRLWAEHALKVSEDRFRCLVEQTSDLIWEVDANFAFTYASPQAKALLGYDPREIIGRTASDFIEKEEAEEQSEGRPTSP